MTGSDSPERGQLLALLLVTLALHLPFLNQAFHMDDGQYLELAKNALQKPLFPNDMLYVFDGGVVSMAGYSHPPLNAYFLALVWKLAGHLTEPLAHGFYLLFPLLCTWAFFSLARRFIAHPALATLLLATVPPLVVMSHTVMADVPTLALTLAGFACFVAGIEDNRPGQLPLAGVALCLAAFCSYVALAALPPLFAFAWLRRRLGKGILAVLAAPVLLIVLWQYANYLHFGQWPIRILREYVGVLGYFQVQLRVRAAVSMFIFLGGTVLFPLLLLALLYLAAPRLAGITGVLGMAALSFSPLLGDYPLPQKLVVGLCFGLGLALTTAAMARLWRSRRLASTDPTGRQEGFLLLWFLLTLGAVLALYSVGSNRYILPLVPPLLLWTFDRLEQRSWVGWTKGLLLIALVWNLAWSRALARADYLFADAYRTYAHGLAEKQLGSKAPLFFSGEWGFRHYLGEIGGRILTFESEPVAGAWVVKSRLCLSRAFDEHLDGALVPVEQNTVMLASRWRLLDRDSRAGFYSTGWGLLPWSWSREALDVVTLYNWSPFFFALSSAQLENAAAEQVFPTRVSHEGQSALVFLQPPDSAITYKLALPAGARLRFRLFAEPAAAGPVALRYRVTVGEAGNSNVVFERAINFANYPAALWQPVEVSLRPWGARTVQLRFSIEGKAARVGWADLTVVAD